MMFRLSKTSTMRRFGRLLPTMRPTLLGYLNDVVCWMTQMKAPEGYNMIGEERSRCRWMPTGRGRLPVAASLGMIYEEGET